MLRRLWADHRKACLLSLAVLVIGVVVSPLVLLAAVLLIGWVLLNKKPTSKYKPLTITEYSETMSEQSQNTDKKLITVRKDALENVKENGLMLSLATEELKADREIVLAAVQQNGLALKYASDELKADGDIVFDAVLQNGLALEHASDELKAEAETVLEAVQQNSLALQYADEKMIEILKEGGMLADQPPEKTTSANESKENNNEMKGIGISNLNQEQLKQLCSKMASLMVFKNTENSYDNLFDIFDFDLSEYKGLDHHTEPESDIYSELEDILTRLLGQTFLIKAIKKPDEFKDIDSQILRDFLLLPQSTTKEELEEWLRDCCENYF